MKVKIAELRRVAGILFEHLEEEGHAEIEIDRDFYWSIPDEKLYSVYEDPSDFTTGQLSDDLLELTKINSGKRKPIAYAFVWLSSLLRFIGAKVVS